MTTTTRKLVSRPQTTPAVVAWAWVGAACLIFILYVLARWFLTGKAVPTDPGPDPLPELQRQFIFWVQWVALIWGVIALWLFVIRPWQGEGRLTTIGMLYICWLTLFFQDPMMNYTSGHLLYNSHMLNLGSWTLGSTPGWISPNGNNLPEPLLLIITGYTLNGYAMCFAALPILNWIRERHPQLHKWKLALVGILILSVLVTIFESLLLRTGVYAYPGSIRALSLFPGETYQFPLTEAIFYGGLNAGSTLVLLLYRDDKGQTFVERGLDSLRISLLTRQWIKFLALFGYVHVLMFALFTIPMQWLATHSDPYPTGYPSYMLNGLCAYGPQADQCPGPGVMMPRP